MTSLQSDTLQVEDDPEALYELSLAERWGDGAPIIPPTDERIKARLAATPYDSDYVLGTLAPLHGVATVELAAINATMAGCTPEAFPLVLAALEGIIVPEFNAFALTTTTSSVFPMLIVNGPSPRRARHRLPSWLPRRRCRSRIDDYRSLCFPGFAQYRRPASGRDVTQCFRSACPFWSLLRRVGRAVAVAIAGRAAGLSVPTRRS